jgi:hypothetical protein
MQLPGKLQIALRALMLLVLYPFTAVAMMRLLTPHVQSPWLLGTIFLLFTLLFLRLVTGIRTRAIFGRRW